MKNITEINNVLQSLHVLSLNQEIKSRILNFKNYKVLFLFRFLRTMMDYTLILDYNQNRDYKLILESLKQTN